jgi:hypothetical protein
MAVEDVIPTLGGSLGSVAISNLVDPSYLAPGRRVACCRAAHSMFEHWKDRVKREKPMRRYADQRIYKIEERLKGAFKPLLCIVEVAPYEAKLNFKVFNVVDDNNEGVFEKKDIVIRNLYDENYL